MNRGHSRSATMILIHFMKPMSALSIVIFDFWLSKMPTSLLYLFYRSNLATLSLKLTLAIPQNGSIPLLQLHEPLEKSLTRSILLLQ